MSFINFPSKPSTFAFNGPLRVDCDCGSDEEMDGGGGGGAAWDFANLSRVQKRALVDALYPVGGYFAGDIVKQNLEALYNDENDDIKIQFETVTGFIYSASDDGEGTVYKVPESGTPQYEELLRRFTHKHEITGVSTLGVFPMEATATTKTTVMSGRPVVADSEMALVDLDFKEFIPSTQINFYKRLDNKTD